MDCNKLGKQIQEWATNLGFMLADGSTPPLNYFALLTATPHRRQLWESLIDSIHSRQKIQQMRKQILVGKLLQKKKYLKTIGLKQPIDRFDLWKEQNQLETEIKEKRNAIVKLERNIMTKASDVLFEICKVSELDKQLEECSEKSVVLKLLTNRKKKLKEDLENCLLKVKRVLEKSEKGISCQTELHDTPDCECTPQGSIECKLHKKIEELCESGVTEQKLWEEVINSKKILLDKFAEFLEEVDSNEKGFLCEKESEVEKSLRLSIAHLKQKATEKSLQIMINSTEGKLLETEVEMLEEKLFQKSSDDLQLNDSMSFISSHKTSMPTVENEKNFKNYLNAMGLESYREFLKEELNRLEEMERGGGGEETKVGDEEFQLKALKAFESIVEDINSYKLKGENVEREIFNLYSQFQSLRNSLEEETKEKRETKTAENVTNKLKMAAEKQIALLLETPLDVFRTVENSTGRTSFERESPSHCLKNYGGEWKQFFRAMLIPPPNDLEIVLSVVEKRKKAVNEFKRFSTERENLAAMQKNIKRQLSSIKYETELCEKNFNGADGILSNVLRKTEELFKEVDFIEKILKNWVEQPYDLMIKETTGGKGLKELEDKYKKEKNE